MDTKKYIKNCPRCGTEIEPERYATTGDKILAGIIGAGGVIAGFALGGPIGATIGAAGGYAAGKKTVMSIENDSDQSQWFIYKCSDCGCEWKEKINTNDNPDDSSWIGNAPY